MVRHFLLSIALIALTTPALAQQEYYVVLEQKKQKCKIETDRPDGEKKVMVGTGSYKTQEEAKAAKEAAPECKAQKNSN